MENADVKNALIMIAVPLALGAMFILIALAPQLLGGVSILEGPMAYSSLNFLEIGACLFALGPVAAVLAGFFLLYKILSGAYSGRKSAPKKPNKRARTKQFKKPPPK